jgi:hypothetical protein
MSATQTAISWTIEELAKVTDPAEAEMLQLLLDAHEVVAEWELEIGRAEIEGDEERIASAEIAADEAYEDANRIQRELLALRAR